MLRKAARVDSLHANNVAASSISAGSLTETSGVTRYAVDQTQADELFEITTSDATVNTSFKTNFVTDFVMNGVRHIAFQVFLNNVPTGKAFVQLKFKTLELPDHCVVLASAHDFGAAFQDPPQFQLLFARRAGFGVDFATENTTGAALNGVRFQGVVICTPLPPFPAPSS
jgi:hypothetical protein